MKCDMLLALGKATNQPYTLLGVNLYADPSDQRGLRRLEGGIHPPDEIIQAGELQIPQVRQTYRVLGVQRNAEWGLSHGCNEHRVVMGMASWRSKLSQLQGLLGSDLVRLTLERCQSARQGVDILTQLIERYGQNGDQIYLIADGQEAFVIEAAGTFWALNECHQTRAVTNCALIRQDWQRLSHGLAEHIIAQGWWADDGSKIDFLGSVGEGSSTALQELKRWGRASFGLSSREGMLDSYQMRPLLAELHEKYTSTSYRRLASSFVVSIPESDSAPVLMWYADQQKGPGFYFPISLDAELPLHCEVGFAGPQVPEIQEHLQAQLDKEAERFLAQANGENSDRKALAQAFMEQQWERVERLAANRKESALPKPKRMLVESREEMMSFVSE